MRGAAAALALATLLAAGCSDEAAPAGDPVRLGVAVALTGTHSDIGVDLVDAMRLAVTTVNQAGGPLGRPLALVVRDTEGTEAGAAAAMDALVEEGVPVVFGGTRSAETLAMLPAAVSAGVVLIAPASTAPALSTADDDGWLFRTSPSDATQGRLLATRAQAAGAASVTVVRDDTAYAVDIADAFEVRAQALNLEVASGTVLAASDDPDTAWSAALASSPDAVLIAADPTAAAAFLDATPSTAPLLLYSDSLRFTAPDSPLPPAHLGLAPSGQGPRASVFTDAYRDAFDAPPGLWGAQSFDAVNVVALAIHAAGSPDAAAIRDHLQDVSRNGSVRGPDQLAQAFAELTAGSSVDYEGASGPVTFDAHGDTLVGWDVWQVVEGALTFVAVGALP